MRANSIRCLQLLCSGNDNFVYLGIMLATTLTQVGLNSQSLPLLSSCRMPNTFSSCSVLCGNLATELLFILALFLNLNKPCVLLIALLFLVRPCLCMAANLLCLYTPGCQTVDCSPVANSMVAR